MLQYTKINASNLSFHSCILAQSPRLTLSLIAHTSLIAINKIFSHACLLIALSDITSTNLCYKKARLKIRQLCIIHFFKDVLFLLLKIFLTGAVYEIIAIEKQNAFAAKDNANAAKHNGNVYVTIEMITF